MLLCMRCCNGDVTLQCNDIAFQLRISDADWAATRDVFLSKNLIDKDNKPTSWDKRQYKSDSSAERVARHRQLQKQDCNGDVTLQKRKCNVLDTDTDTDKPSSATDVAALDEKQIYSKAFIAFWELYPIRVNKGAAFKAFQKIRAAEYPVVRAGLERKKQSQAWLKDNGKFIPHAATWLNARGWEDEDAPAAIPAKPTYRAKTQAEMDAEQEQRRVEMEERKRKILAMPVEPNPWEVNHV